MRVIGRWDSKGCHLHLVLEGQRSIGKDKSGGYLKEASKCMCRSGWRKPDHQSVPIFKSEWLLCFGMSSALWKAYLEFIPPLHVSPAIRLTLHLLPCPVIQGCESQSQGGCLPGLEGLRDVGIICRGWGMLFKGRHC